MTESQEAKSPNPYQPYIDLAREGDLTLRFSFPNQSDRVLYDAEEFVKIDRTCEAFKAEIRSLQVLAESISERDDWQLGERHPDLVSAQTVVRRLREKAMGAENSLYNIMQLHYEHVCGIQELHKVIAQRYADTDAEFAAEFKHLMNTMDPGRIPHVDSSVSDIARGVLG